MKLIKENFMPTYEQFLSYLRIAGQYLVNCNGAQLGGLCLGDGVIADVYFDTTGSSRLPETPSAESYVAALRGMCDYMNGCGVNFELGSLDLGGDLELDGFKCTITELANVRTINMKPTVWMYQPDIPETATMVSSSTGSDKCEFRITLS